MSRVISRAISKESPKEAHARRMSVHSRRNFLRGLGVSIALPTFGSLLPRGARAQGDRPQRLLTIYHPNGMPKSNEDSQAHRSDIDPDLLDPFSAFADRMSIVRNMNASSMGYRNIAAKPDTSHAHMRNFLALYNGDPLSSYGDEPRTFDQYIAEDERHQGSARNSIAINLGMKTNAHAGILPVLFNSLSWKGPSQPVAPFADPRRLFDDLFGRGGMVADDPAAEAARRALVERKRLFLDVAMDQIHSLKGRLGAGDQVRLDEYLESIRDLDVRTRALLEEREEIERMCTSADAPLAVIDGQSVMIPLELYVETLDVMQDLTVRAFQCDLTRVATFAHDGAAGSNNNLRCPWVEGLEGRTSLWHALSHWFDAGTTSLSTDLELNRRDFKRVIKWHYGRMADFLTKLQSTPGTWGGDSLLDETLVAIGTSMDYPGHRNGMLHQMLFGGGNGAFREGQDVDVRFDSEVGTASLWYTVMRGFGIDADRYGEARQPLEALLA